MTNSARFATPRLGEAGARRAQIINPEDIRLSSVEAPAEWIEVARTLKISPLYYGELVESIVRRGFFCDSSVFTLQLSYLN